MRARKISGNFLRDYKNLVNSSPALVVDVGANVGQSAQLFLAEFPDAIVHCLEPSPQAIESLRLIGQIDTRLETHQLALGKSAGFGYMERPNASPNNRVLTSGGGGQDGPHHEVKIMAGDQWLDQQNINHVDLLKIDVEGFENEVLQGFSGGLNNGIVDVIKIEVGFSEGNDVHVPFPNIDLLLRNKGYELLGFWDQVLEWKQMKTCLRRADAVFIRGDLAAGISPFE